MTHLGTFLLAGADKKSGEALIAALGKSGLRGHHEVGLAAIIDRARADHPDILVVDRAIEGGNILELARQVKAYPETCDIPICLLAERFDSAMARAVLALGLDDLIVAPFNTDMLTARLKPLLRLSTMHTELLRRAQVATSFGLVVPERVETAVNLDKQSLLVVCAGSAQEKLDYRDALSPADLIITESLYEAESLLTQRNFDAALLDVRGKPADYLGFCSQVRNNSRLFNLPVVLAMRPEDMGDGIEAYRRGASRVIPKPIDADRLQLGTQILVRRQRLRWKIREALLKTLAQPTADAHTATYGAPFFHSYVESRLDFAKAGNRHLSVVFVNIPNVPGIAQQFGDEAAGMLMSQLGNWINGLLRVEDLVSRTDTSEFCLVLPDTPIEEAEVVMHRIASVLTYTDFAVPEVYQPVRVWVEIGSAIAQANDTVASLLARAHTNIN
ncbi:MAG: diguanylate cyclase [Rhodospirillales bacterium]|nr:diguanylate cyclase [Rhodospirillales bacterium]